MNVNICFHMKETDAGFQSIITPLTEREKHHHDTRSTRIKEQITIQIKKWNYCRPHGVLVFRKYLLWLIRNTCFHGSAT